MARASKASLLIIFVTVFIDLLGFGIVLPLLPLYAKYYAAEDMTLGLLMASFSAMQFLFAPLWGRISDRVGRRPILILGLAGSTVSYALFGYAASLPPDAALWGLSPLGWLFVSRIGAGIAGATIPTAQAYIADTTGPEERAKGMALIGAAFGIGFTFGPLLGAAFASAELDAAPNAAPGYVAAVLSGLALLSAIFVLPESLKPGSQPAERRGLSFVSLRKAIARPAVAIVLVMMFVAVFAFGQFESTLALLAQNLGLAPRYNLYVFAYVGFILTLSQGLIVRRLVPRMGEFRMSVAGVVLMTSGLLLVGFAGQSGSRALLYSVLPVAVMGFSALNPCLQSMLSRRTPASDQGEMLGLGQSFSALARIFGPFVGVRLFFQEVTLPFWVGGGIMAVSLLLVLAIGSRAPEDEESNPTKREHTAEGTATPTADAAASVQG